MKKPKMQYDETLKMWKCYGQGCTHIAPKPETAYLGHHNKRANFKRLRLIK